MTTPKDLASRIREGLRDTTVPLWLPDLSADLATSGWTGLKRTLDLDHTSYGTARMLLKDAVAPREIVAHVGCRTSGEAGLESIPIEILPTALAAQCAGPEIRFYNASEIGHAGIDVRVGQALNVLSSVPSVSGTVCALVRALHLIDTQDDEVDISFSDPTLPFSAFISVPGPHADAATLRVAEALLHEAMHLQLTLVEAALPLVNNTERSYFSPWRNEYRTARGVLHALYVFRVIDEFLASTNFDTPLLEAAREHATERRTTIALQVNEIQDFSQCNDLTSDGATLVSRLLDRRFYIQQSSSCI